MSCGSVVLSIAGRDSTGQAGLDMDVRTIEALGGIALTLETADTQQHVSAPMSVTSAALIEFHSAMASILSNKEVGSVKIGMLATRSMVETVAEGLKDYTGPVVLDPVLASSSGLCLLQPDAFIALESLTSRVSVVTPNLEEYAALGGHEWRERVGVPVLLKGGHGDGEVLIDRLFLLDGSISAWRHPKRVLENPRGTGCALSSAIAFFLAQGQDLEAAIGQGISYLQNTF